MGMTHKTKANIFWTLRRCWHAPQSNMECYKLPTFWNELYLYRYYWNSKRRIKNLYLVFKRHCKALVKRSWNRFLYIQPLRCNGNKGGWRTIFCEWLEKKARWHGDCDEQEF